MRNWAMIRAGIVQTVIVADSDLSQQLGYDAAVDVTSATTLVLPGYVWDGHTFSPGAAPAVTPYYGTCVTPLAFRQRFTNAETVAIYSAASTTVQIQVYLDTLSLARYVDLADPQTNTDLLGLVAAGLLTDARRIAITSAPVTAKEAP